MRVKSDGRVFWPDVNVKHVEVEGAKDNIPLSMTTKAESMCTWPVKTDFKYWRKS